MQVTVLLEVNVHLPKPMASLWVIPGGYDDNNEDDLYYYELDRAVKLLGPIPPEDCHKVFQTTIKLLQALGHEVDSDTTADD